MREADFPDHAWTDMCAIYRDAPLARACIDVQSSLAADVPLLLLLCLADKAGHAVDPEGVRALEAAGQAWRDAAILPLRQARTAMKGRFGAPAEADLRRRIKGLELEAERLHVLRLAAVLPAAAGGTPQAAFTYLAMRGGTMAAAARFIAIFDRAYDAQDRSAVASAEERSANE
jgi:uncharacterized protein (TIGR02444 family)